MIRSITSGLIKAYNPDQERDDHGRWSGSGGGGGGGGNGEREHEPRSASGWGNEPWGALPGGSTNVHRERMLEQRRQDEIAGGSGGSGKSSHPMGSPAQAQARGVSAHDYNAATHRLLQTEHQEAAKTSTDSTIGNLHAAAAESHGIAFHAHRHAAEGVSSAKTGEGGSLHAMVQSAKAFGASRTAKRAEVRAKAKISVNASRQKLMANIPKYPR